MLASRYFALVPAAGIGARIGADCPKQYLHIAGKPMLMHALQTFAESPAIEHCFVVVSKEDGYIAGALKSVPLPSERVTVIFNGGPTRHASVMNGLRAIRDRVNDDDWVMVHDAARPGLTSELIDKLIGALRDDEVGGLLAMPVVDTLKRSDNNDRVQQTVPRAGLWAAQTP